MPVLHGVPYIRRINFYDAFTIANAGPPDVPVDEQRPPSLTHANGWMYLFGNANLGQSHLCNLPSESGVAADQPAKIHHWYARTDVLPEALTERQRASLHRFAASTFVTLIMGDMPQQGWRWSLADLLDQRPWEPPSVTAEQQTPEALEAFRARFEQRCAEGARPLVVPVRQYVRVSVEAFQGQVHRLVQDLDGIPVMMWIHLEGISVRDHG